MTRFQIGNSWFTNKEPEPVYPRLPASPLLPPVAGAQYQPSVLASQAAASTWWPGYSTNYHQLTYEQRAETGIPKSTWVQASTGGCCCGGESWLVLWKLYRTSWGNILQRIPVCNSSLIKWCHVVSSMEGLPMLFVSRNIRATSSETNCSQHQNNRRKLTTHPGCRPSQLPVLSKWVAWKSSKENSL